MAEDARKVYSESAIMEKGFSIVSALVSGSLWTIKPIHHNLGRYKEMRCDNVTSHFLVFQGNLTDPE